MTPITLRVKFKVPQDLPIYASDSDFLHGVQLFMLIVAVFTWGTALSLFRGLHVKKQRHKEVMGSPAVTQEAQTNPDCPFLGSLAPQCL